MAEANSTSRILTLVFTDLADSTALKSERGDSVVDALLTRHREHVARLAEECAGRIIDWAGDGCFLTFETSSAAVLFSLQLQKAHSDEPDLPGLRIGIHLGEVTERLGPDGEVQVKGLAVDVAARVEGLAKPGQVLMSSSVYNSAKQRMGVEAMGMPLLWQLHGTYALKGFDTPLDIGEAGIQGVAPLEAPKAGGKARLIRRAKQQAVYKETQSNRVPVWGMAVMIAMLAAISYLVWERVTNPEAGTPSGPLITSLAVLPLDNLMNDPEQDYFVDGMTEAITAELSKISSLKVISRTSAMHYRDTNLTAPEIAAELGVTGLIEGSVLRDGEDVRITVQLIDAPDDRHLWSESYTNTVTSVLKLQAEVALAIAGEIRATLSDDERERIADARDVDRDAYDLYLRGIANYSDFSKEGFLKSIDYFERAVEIEPEFAEAWTALGSTHWEILANGLDAPDPYRQPAREAFLTALALDDTIATAHFDLAALDVLESWAWDDNERRQQRALLLDPNDGFIRWQAGFFHQNLGLWSDARADGVKALEVDPLNEYTRAQVGSLFVIAGDAEAAITTLEPLLDERPDNLMAQNFLIFAYWAAGRFEEAVETAQRHAEQREHDAYSQIHLLYALAANGEDDAARQIIDDLESTGQLESESSDFVALAYVFLGEIDTALEYLERSFRSASPVTMMVVRGFPFTESALTDPNFVAFRTDPRYFDLLDRMKYSSVPPGHPGYDEQQTYLVNKAAKEMLAEQGRSASAGIKSLAVLPLKNLKGDPAEDYFVDGMTEAITGELSKMSSLKVISRTSTARYKDTALSMPEIAEELGVQGIIEGSVLRDGDDVTIRVYSRSIVRRPNRSTTMGG